MKLKEFCGYAILLIFVGLTQNIELLNVLFVLITMAIMVIIKISEKLIIEENTCKFT